MWKIACTETVLIGPHTAQLPLHVQNPGRHPSHCTLITFHPHDCHGTLQYHKVFYKYNEKCKTSEELFQTFSLPVLWTARTAYYVKNSSAMCAYPAKLRKVCKPTGHGLKQPDWSKANKSSLVPDWATKNSLWHQRPRTHPIKARHQYLTRCWSINCLAWHVDLATSVTVTGHQYDDVRDKRRTTYQVPDVSLCCARLKPNMLSGGPVWRTKWSVSMLNPSPTPTLTHHTAHSNHTPQLCCWPIVTLSCNIV